MSGDGREPSGESVSLWAHVRALFVERAKVLASVTVDAGFLVAVAAVNVSASRTLSNLQLADTDLVVARTLQWMFAVVTVGITLSFLVRDLVSAFARGVRRSGD